VTQPGPWPRSLVVSICRRLLATGSRAVVPSRRREWLAEWEGELWALQATGVRMTGLLRFTLGVVFQARHERRREEGLLNGLGLDCRHAIRRLRRSPGFAIVVIVVLALGIGANTALFSALDAMLRSSPYPDAERLVLMDILLAQRAGAPPDTLPWSYPKFELARRQVRSLDAVAGFNTRTGNLTGPEGATRIGLEYVSPAYFELLGVQAILGRTFLPSEDPPTPAAIVLLAHSLWTTRYGSDPGVVGRTIQLDGASLEVVGVLPQGFQGVSGAAEAWVPLAGIIAMRGGRRLELPWAHWLRVLGRLAPGSSLEQARAESAALGIALTKSYPDPSGGAAHGVTVIPFLQAKTNPITRLALTVVSAAGMLLLLVACANVAGLLLARASARRGEAAVRAALGAGRMRLVRESLLESLMLALAGGVLGVVLARAAERVVALAVSRSLDASGTRNLEFFDTASLAVDANVLTFGIGLALMTGLLSGLLPAGTSSRPDLARQLRSGDRSLGRHHAETADLSRGLLVAGQLALTLVLLAGAGLMGASLAGVAAIDPGFANERVLTLRFEHPPGPPPEHDLVFEHLLVERLSSLPGVESVAIGPCPPLTGACEVVGVRRVDDGPEVDYGDMEGIIANAVSEDYFGTLGIRLFEGRGLTSSDRAGSQPVVVVNEAAARKFFPGGSALGHEIAITAQLTADASAEVVGVVADVRYGRLDEPAMPALYYARQQDPPSYGTMYLLTSGDPHAIIDGVRREVAALEPDLPLYDVATMADRRALATARTRIVLGLLLAFGVTGLLLSSVGLYGTVAYSAIRRMREMGLRLALGAAKGDVLRLMLKQPALHVLLGAVLGVTAALVLTRHVDALLYEVDPGDPRILALATATLLLVVLVAAWIPAIRATRVDPATSLREN